MQYKIGPWSFFPEKCLLINDSIEKELEPLLFKLLMYFVQNPVRIIKREELAKEVWRQSYVDDNAINRAISELRKQLATPQYKSLVVRTHYRKGYSMNVPVIVVSDAPEEQQSGATEISEQELSKDPRHIDLKETTTLRAVTHQRALNIVLYTIFSAILILLAYIVGSNDKSPHEINQTLAINKSKSVSSKKVSVRAVNNVSVVAATKNVGAEYLPNISSNKRFLSYINKTDHQTKSYIREIHSARDVEVTYQSFEVEILSWQPASENFLAKVTEPSSNVCRFVVFDAKTFPSIIFKTDIKSCSATHTNSAQTNVDGTILYYEKQDEEGIGFEVKEYDIASGVERVIIPSERSAGSKSYFVLSGDGKRMLYRKKMNCDTTCLFVFDIQSQEHTHVYTSTQKNNINVANWYQGSEQIVVNDERKLVFVDVDNASRTELLLDSNIAMDYLSALGEQEVFYTQSNSKKMSLQQVAVPFTAEQPMFTSFLTSEGTNHSPNFHLGQLYFISTRTGQSQFWRTNTQGRIEQLSAFELTRQYTLYTPAVSFDLNYILFKRDNDLEILDVNEQSTYVIDGINGALVSSYVFSHNTKFIYFLYTSQNVTQLWQFDLITRSKQKLSERDISHLLSDASGNSYYIEKNWLKSIKTGFQMEMAFQIPRDTKLIDMTDKFFYATDGKNVIYKVNIETGVIESKELPTEVIAISVASDDNSMIFQTASQLETQIKLLTWD